MGRDEQLNELKNTVREALIRFHDANGVAPRRLIFYRDGVAHNMFAKTCAVEIAHIFDACRSIDETYVPQLVFIVVQQRNR